MSVKPIQYEIVYLDFRAREGFVWADVSIKAESIIGIFINLGFKIPLRVQEHETLESLHRRAIDSARNLLSEDELRRLQTELQ